ncbi:4869_t:CDS:2 [Paraglomus brasilianum]|uniref:4869_t:CDS:1 n=1 Tax=Paraglomus brasilianum TaxID=144538 RepID=A0A9N9CYH5_9GLOM|nr:4869_t:CDS:2 [Paraglomus brasilianum]
MKWRAWFLIPILGLVGRLGKADTQTGTAQNQPCFTLSSPPTTATSCQHGLLLSPGIQKHSSLLTPVQSVVDRLCIPNSPATVKFCKYMETRHIKIEKTLTHHVNKRQSSGYKLILGKRGNKKEVNTESKSNSRAYAKYHVSGRKDRRKRREKRLYADRSTIGVVRICTGRKKPARSTPSPTVSGPLADNVDVTNVTDTRTVETFVGLERRLDADGMLPLPPPPPIPGNMQYVYDKYADLLPSRPESIYSAGTASTGLYRKARGDRVDVVDRRMMVNKADNYVGRVGADRRMMVNKVDNYLGRVEADRRMMVNKVNNYLASPNNYQKKVRGNSGNSGNSSNIRIGVTVVDPTRKQYYSDARNYNSNNLMPYDNRAAQMTRFPKQAYIPQATFGRGRNSWGRNWV